MRTLGIEGDDGVERRVQLVDPAEVVIEEFAARQLATPDGLCQHVCGRQRDVLLV
jgi:hypothetical protein